MQRVLKGIRCGTVSVMASTTGSGSTLRERKRDRTRRALVDAAIDLFERNGYDRTTVADIAEAADIGTRTFFSYFASKEELLFPESDVGAADGEPDDMVDRIAAVRVALFRTVPAVRGRALQIQLDAQREIAGHLQRAFPAELDAVTAAALVG